MGRIYVKKKPLYEINHIKVAPGDSRCVTLYNFF